MFKFLTIIIISLALLVPASALAQKQNQTTARYIPLTFRDTLTGEIVSPLPFVNGVPLCHDPLFEARVLGSTCYDEADPTDPVKENYRPIAEECVEVDGYSLSKGSYIENGAIMGSPCDPVEFCSDPNSNDPVVRDHCEDIWTDTDDETETGTGNEEEECDEICEGQSRFIEDEDKLRENIREAETEEESSGEDNGDDPAPIID